MTDASSPVSFGSRQAGGSGWSAHHAAETVWIDIYHW
jgi:hypothetical protein